MLLEDIWRVVLCSVMLCADQDHPYCPTVIVEQFRTEQLLKKHKYTGAHPQVLLLLCCINSLERRAIHHDRDEPAQDRHYCAQKYLQASHVVCCPSVLLYVLQRSLGNTNDSQC